MPDQRRDHVQLNGSLAHLPERFREVARKANQAGLEGYKFVDADYGLDLERAIATDSIQARVRILYEKVDSPDAETLKLAWCVIDAAMVSYPNFGERLPLEKWGEISVAIAQAVMEAQRAGQA